MANITNASSPKVEIIAVTSAAKLTTRCVNKETTVNAPRQPGMIPRIAAKKICKYGFC